MDPNTRITKKTGFYSIYSAVGLGLKNMTEELEFLNNVPLTEAKMLDKIRSIWNKFISYLKNMWKKAKEWIGDSWQRLIQFLGLEPVIMFNNTPRW